MTEYLFKTERLGIRKWRESDLLEFSKMGQDEKVMRYFPSLLSEQQTIDFVKRMQIQQKKKGYAYLPLEKLDNQEFIGMLGMADQDYNIKLDKSESIISEFS